MENISDWIIYGIGFLAQFLFSARLISQWLLSEKSKKVETPSSFWKLSLLGSILLFIYGYLREDLAIMLGQAVIYVIYIRNLQLQKQWTSSNIFLKIVVLGFPLIITIYLSFFSQLSWKELVTGEKIAPWLIIFGIIGQLIFNARFFYQWIYSERKKESSLPLGFWLISLTGAVFIFLYGIFRNDPVLIAAHFFGGIVYIRNLFIMRKSMP